MRSVLIIFALLALGCQSAPAPKPASASADSGLGFPTAEAVAAWPVQAEQARSTAIAIMDGAPDRHTEYRTTPILRGGYGLWQVQAASRIAGGWEAEVDGRTGRLYSARRFPGR